MKLVFSSLPAALLVVLSLAVLPAIAMPPSGDVVAAVFPPYWSAGEVAAAAASAGRIVRRGGVGFVMVVALDKDGGAKLNAAGALLQLDPRVLGCGPAS